MTKIDDAIYAAYRALIPETAKRTHALTPPHWMVETICRAALEAALGEQEAQCQHDWRGDHDTNGFVCRKCGQRSATTQSAKAPDPVREAKRRVIEAASKLKFGAYPAHGSGFVMIVTEGNVDDLDGALEALATVRSQEEGR